MREQDIPLYKKVALELREEIIDGKWVSGDFLPSEAELIKRFNVSRITVRQALQLLELEGLIIRQQGKGTYIPGKELEQDLLGIHDFAKRLHKQGHRPSFIIESIKVQEPNKLIAQILGLTEGESVYRIERIKLEDERPLMFERIFLPIKFAPDLSINEASKLWLSELLKQRSLPITKVKQTIQPILIADYEAAKLSVPSRSLGLFVDRLSWSNENIVLFTRSIARADNARYFIESGSRN